jgi:ubiquinone/menaquinone biosynthesis C-methylase UbiE
MDASVDAWSAYWSGKGLKRKIIEILRRHYFARAFAGHIRKNIREGSRILEAGCGSGEILRCLGRGCTCVGCDIDETALKLGQGKFQYRVRCDIRRLPFKDKAFDVAYNQGVMEHFRDEEFVEVLRELKRVSRKVIVLVPASTSLFRIYNPFKEVGNIYPFFTKARLKALLCRVFQRTKEIYRLRTGFLTLSGKGEDA